MIKIIDLKDDSIKFKLKNVDISFVNAIRRIMISEIPTFAIDVINIIKNESNVHDETLAHKLGLIPLYCPNNLKINNCDCKFECPQCTIILKSNITCQDEIMEFTSFDLNTNNLLNVKPVIYKINNNDYPISILNLYNKQKIIFEAKAKIGIGKEHAKWSPVSIATFDYDEINNEFIFYFESNGSYKPIDILKKSLQILSQKLNNLKNIEIKD